MTKANFENRLRFGAIRNGQRRAFDRLEYDINNRLNDADYTFNINASICELLFWIIAHKDWHLTFNRTQFNTLKKNYKNGSNRLYGLRHAYNVSKYNMNYICLFGFKGEIALSDAISVFDNRTDVIWINCSDDKEHGDQVKNYREYLKGNEVITTFREAITFLNAADQDILFPKLANSKN